MSDARLDVTVVGSEENLAAFVQLCKTMDLLGRAGASRTIVVPYDGDGAARLRFDFGATDVTDVEGPAEADLDQDEIVVGFG